MKFYIEGEYNEEGCDVISFNARTYKEAHREHYGNSIADPYIHEVEGSPYRMPLEDIEYFCIQLCENEIKDMRERGIYIKNPLFELEVNYVE